MEQFQVLFQQLLQNISHSRGTRFPLRNTALSAEHVSSYETHVPLRYTFPSAEHGSLGRTRHPCGTRQRCTFSPTKHMSLCGTRFHLRDTRSFRIFGVFFRFSQFFLIVKRTLCMVAHKIDLVWAISFICVTF